MTTEKNAGRLATQERPMPPENFQSPSAEVSLRADIGGMTKLFTSLFGGNEKKAREFSAGAWQAVQMNPDLMDNNLRGSMCIALGETAVLDLQPSPMLAEVYYIPRGGKVQLMIGYRGLVKMATRSGLVEWINVDVVRRGEFFEHLSGTNPSITHRKPLEGVDDDDSAILAAYCVVKLRTSPLPIPTVIKRHDLDKAAGKSTGPVWKQWFRAMAQKHAIKQALKIVPLGKDDAIGLARDAQREIGNDPEILEQLHELQRQFAEQSTARTEESGGLLGQLGVGA
jgi:recombination protein RecT